MLKNKKTTINPQNIANNPPRISKIKPFIDHYNWKEIDFPYLLKNWKKFEQNNKAIALNIVFVPHNTKQINMHTNQNIILSVKIKKIC